MAPSGAPTKGVQYVLGIGRTPSILECSRLACTQIRVGIKLQPLMLLHVGSVTNCYQQGVHLYTRILKFSAKLL